MKNQLRSFISKKILKDEKAEKSIFHSILGIIYDLGIDEDFILKWIKDAENDEIFENLDFINGGNWVKALKNKEYITFMSEMFQCRPIGLGTPNAACGEGELMLILSSPRISRPTKNDIKIDENTFNLKNDEPRLFAEITGKSLNKKLIEICNNLGFTPNVFKGKKYVQLLNKRFVEDHWNTQFEKTNISEIKILLSSFLINLFYEKNINHKEIEKIIDKVLIGKKLVWDLWVNEVILFLFKNGSDKNENFILMNINGIVNKIPTSVSDFTDLLENNKVVFSQDYFRMFQDKKVGVYIKFVN